MLAPDSGSRAARVASSGRDVATTRTQLGHLAFNSISNDTTVFPRSCLPVSTSFVSASSRESTQMVSRPFSGPSLLSTGRTHDVNRCRAEDCCSIQRTRLSRSLCPRSAIASAILPASVARRNTCPAKPQAHFTGSRDVSSLIEHRCRARMRSCRRCQAPSFCEQNSPSSTRQTNDDFPVPESPNMTTAGGGHSNDLDWFDVPPPAPLSCCICVCFASSASTASASHVRPTNPSPSVRTRASTWYLNGSKRMRSA